MRERLTAQVNRALNFCLIAAAFVTPLLFTDKLTDYYDLPKVLFVVGMVILMLLLWTISWVLKGKVFITRTPLDLPLLLFILVVILSAIFSQLKYVAFFGSLPRVHESALSWIAYALLFFIAVSVVKSQTQIRSLVVALLSSGALVSFVTLLSYFNKYLPFDFAQNPTFTPAGMTFASTGLSALLLPLVLVSLTRKEPNDKEQLLPKLLYKLALILFTLNILLTGNLASLVSAILGVGLVVFYGGVQTFKKESKSFAIPLLIIALVAILGYVPNFGPSTTLRMKNPIYKARVNFTPQLQLDLVTSWKVAASSFRDAIPLGTGPSTFGFNFTYYKPVEYNQLKTWSQRFDFAHNEFLQTLSTLGLSGFLSFTLLLTAILSFAYKALAKSSSEIGKSGLGLASATITGVALLLLHISTPTTIVAYLLLLALLIASHKNISSKVEEIAIGIKASRLYDSSLITGDVLPLILSLSAVIILVAALWFGVPFVRADLAHQEALKLAPKEGVNSFNKFVAARNLNPLSDLYRVDLAQANFLLANKLASVKGPTDASQSGSLNDQDKQNIQSLLSNAIQEGKIATILNPLNVRNWEVLGSIYRQISGVANNASVFALDSLGRAIQRDPLNPNLRISVGSLYYSLKNYDLAIRFFTDAANLKPDLASAYYNLALALRDKGDIKSAILAGEKVVSLLKPDNPDYKAASDFLAELKKKDSEAATQTPPQTEPAAKESGALEKKQLPKVLNLPRKDNISTPPAIKK